MCSSDLPDGTQYSDQYLNQTGSKGFEGLSVFYGAKAQVTSAQMYDANGNLMSGSTQPATMTSDRVLRPATSYTILANAYKIDGVPTVVVQGKYETSPSIAGTKSAAIQAMDFLVTGVRDKKL